MEVAVGGALDFLVGRDVVVGVVEEEEQILWLEPLVAWKALLLHG